MKVFARVVDGKVTEYPVYEVHITTRGEPITLYSECVFDTKPEVPPYHYAEEIVIVDRGQVKVSYKIVALTLENLFSLIHNKPGNRIQNTVVNIADVELALVNRIVDLINERTQQLLEDFTATRGYSVLSAVSYEFSSIARYAEDAKCVKDIRDQLWPTLINYLNEVLAGTKPIPKSWVEIEALFPAFVWTN